MAKRPPLPEPEPNYGRPPKPGAGLWTVLWFLIAAPFKLIGAFTKGANILILWPLRFMLGFAFVGLVIGCAIVFLYGTMANRYDMSEVVKMPERTIVLDRKNREIGRLHGENRESVKIDQVPYYLVDAIITREDKRFYSHGGVDWIGVGRSVMQVLKHKRTTQGASTLTMQLARNSFGLKERSLHRKLLEVALAKRIEATYSKDQILEAYINRIFWGHTYLGISSAARCYFGKIPSELTLSESALLAGIIYGPNEFSPIRKPEKAKHVRDLVLQSMLDDGKITHAEYTQAMNEQIVVKPPISRSEENYAMDLIRRELERILEEEEIQLGGLVVRTTLDLEMQNAALDALNKQLATIEGYKHFAHPTKAAFEKETEKMSKEDKEKLIPKYVQGSVVVLDNVSGATIVMVGGRDAEESKFNRAIQAKRQIGSVYKPFVYATAMQRGLSASSMISDNPLAPGEVAKAGRWSPRNSDGKYLGNQPVWFGLVKSRNTMSVRVGQFASMDNVIKCSQMAGFTSKIVPSPASYLGTFDATPYEVASAYTVFANGGVRPTPYIIENISDSTGTLHFAKYTATRVFTERAANQVTRILERVTQPGGTAGNMKALGFGKPCGGKTGTTDNYTNAWYVGFTSSLTGCVWVGLDQPKKIMERGYGGTLALPVWASVMQAAEKAGYPCGAIKMKAGSKEGAVLICRESKMLAHNGCQKARCAYPENLLTKMPQELCTQHNMEAEVVDESQDKTQIREAEVIYEADSSPEEPDRAAEVVDEPSVQAEIVE